MKQLFLIFLFIIIALTTNGQTGKRISFGTTVGTGLAMSSPSCTPLTWQALGYYLFNERLSIGAGTGLSFYEKMLIPVFGDIRYQMGRTRKFTPFVECGIGYSFAPGKNVNGGFYLYPSIGLQYEWIRDTKLQLALGYEMQDLSLLKTYKGGCVISEFEENLSHHTLSIRIGLLF